MRTHTHELRALKDWVERFLQRTHNSRRSDNEMQDIIADLETYSACYFDLVRQSTVHSVELGRVQALLWNDFINLFQRLFTIHEKTQSTVDLVEVTEAPRSLSLPALAQPYPLSVTVVYRLPACCRNKQESPPKTRP